MNVNPVEKSSVMFVRRVFETLAGGVPLIYNYSRGIEHVPGIIIRMTVERKKRWPVFLKSNV